LLPTATVDKSGSSVTCVVSKSGSSIPRDVLHMTHQQ
jgi:hypothetical protein